MEPPKRRRGRPSPSSASSRAAGPLRRSSDSRDEDGDGDGGVFSLRFRRRPPRNARRGAAAAAVAAFTTIACLSISLPSKFPVDPTRGPPPPPPLQPSSAKPAAAVAAAKKPSTEEDDDVLCHRWDASSPTDHSEVDRWWEARYPTYDAAYDLDNVTHLCFRRTPTTTPPPPPATATETETTESRESRKYGFLRSLTKLQFGTESNCSSVHTKPMWSSGWGADFSNVADGLLYGLETDRPFQITFRADDPGWHYATLYEDGSNPVCPSKDMFCYFLPLGKCPPGVIDEEAFRAKDYDDAEENGWAKEYATRPKSWLRRRVADYLRTQAPTIQTPCAAIHVRRADVVLHESQSRRYHSVVKYLTKMRRSNLDRRNVLLVTDDADAIDEAIEFHPEVNWMYLNRTRHRGASGGWENQVPSSDPALEVVILLSLLRLVRRCDVFVQSTSLFGDLLYRSMADAGRRERRAVPLLKVDEGLEVYDPNNAGSVESLAAELERRREEKKTKTTRATTTAAMNGTKKEGKIAKEERDERPTARDVQKKTKKKGRIAEEERRERLAARKPVKGGSEAMERRGGGHDRGSSCAPHNGVIVLNLLGLLGNNILEVGFANVLAKELCWGVLYRNAWISPFLEAQARRCFPNALLPPPNLTAAESKELKLHPSPPWEGIGDVREEHDAADRWVASLEKKNVLLPCRQNHCDFTRGGTNDILDCLRSPNSTRRALLLHAFFIHHGWIARRDGGGYNETTEDLRRWLTPHESCCPNVPPEDAVVIHLPDFELEEGEPLVRVRSGFYRDLLERTGLSGRPIWIVCQPKSVDSELVRNVTADFPSAVTVPRGEDQYDSFCTLTRAKTLVLSHKSTFSQAAALIADPAVEVHYPIFNLKPFLTLGIPSWRYHMVNESRDGVKVMDLPLDNLTFRMDWETPPQVQIQEVGLGSISGA